MSQTSKIRKCLKKLAKRELSMISKNVNLFLVDTNDEMEVFNERRNSYDRE
jgi:hypothetical protein